MNRVKEKIFCDQFTEKAFSNSKHSPMLTTEMQELRRQRQKDYEFEASLLYIEFW